MRNVSDHGKGGWSALFERIGEQCAQNLIDIPVVPVEDDRMRNQRAVPGLHGGHQRLWHALVLLQTQLQHADGCIALRIRLDVLRATRPEHMLTDVRVVSE